MKILLGSGKYENKARYVDRVMSKNAKVDTLSEEQHDVLRWLCKIRHEIHSLDIFKFLSIPQYLLDEYESINDKLTEVDLSVISDLPDVIDFPSDIDYYEIMTDDEREYWDNLAQSIDGHNGFSLWVEESIGDDVVNIQERINSLIERYLQDIDKEYGTHYAPTGWARLR